MWMKPEPKREPKRTDELTSKFEAEWAAARVRAPRLVKVSCAEYVANRYELLGVK